MRIRALALSIGLLSLSYAATPAPTPTVAASPASTYTVRTGDTLYGIAQQLGTTVEQLQATNGLSGLVINVGQVLKVPQVAGSVKITPPVGSGGVSAAGSKPPPPARQTPSTATSTRAVPTASPPVKGTAGNSSAATSSGGVQLGERLVKPGGSIFTVGGVTVVAPFQLHMGDAFVLRLSGPQAATARVKFTSEVGEDVRKPAESLTPIGAAGEYEVIGRVVLGKKTPVTYTVQVGKTLATGRIAVVSGVTGSGRLVHLNLPKATADRLTDPGRTAEEALVEKAYALRTAQAWDLPFQPAVQASVIPGSFGQNRTYVAGQPVKYHYGADYPAPLGTPVTAVNDGKVVIVGLYPVRGNLVAIDHGAGVVSLYFHQSKILVRVGQQVTRGQQIGMVGSTGLSTGPHLHLEIRVRGEATQPTDWFSRIYPRPSVK